MSKMTKPDGAPRLFPVKHAARGNCTDEARIRREVKRYVEREGDGYYFVAFPAGAVTVLDAYALRTLTDIIERRNAKVHAREHRKAVRADQKTMAWLNRQPLRQRFLLASQTGWPHREVR
jgi:hypothetical protein